jgi:N-acetylglutamate synthase-like GNAT family acetyltransferase
LSITVLQKLVQQLTNVKEKMDDGQLMNTLSFTTIAHPEWDKKIATGLRKECELLTDSRKGFKQHTIYVKSGDTFVGGMSIEQHGEILWIDSLWVEPHFRKQGIGNKLLQKAILFATQNKIKEVQLNTYFQESHSFFLTYDFEDVAVIPHWKYGLDCYLMRKKV